METALGTSRWATKEEIFETRFLSYAKGKDTDFFIGETDFLVRQGWLDRVKRNYFVGGRTDQHALVCMGARGGKGTSVIIPNLIYWQGSCVVVDPKGENATITAARRGDGVENREDYSKHITGLGQKTLVLDPFSVAQVEDKYRATFNPLDAVQIGEDEAIDEAGRIADALVVQDGEKDSHWNESARYLIKGLILHVLTDPDFEGQRNLITVRKLLISGDWLALEAIKSANTGKSENDPDWIFEADPFEMLWLAMIENTACDGVIAGVGRSIESMADRERSSVLSTAARNTEFIDSPQMRRSLVHSTFSLSELKTSEKGVSLFLSLPTRYMGTHHRWLRMLVTLTLDEMEKIAHQPKCGSPVLMVLDEFPGLGRIKRIEDATSQIPGYGVKLVFVCQSLSQLKEVYKDNWETFIACSGIALFAANQDEFTLKYLARRLGESEITRMVSSTGHNRGFSLLKPWTLFTGSKTRSKSEQLHKRALLNEDEVSRTFAASENKILAFVSGMQPMSVNRVPYYDGGIFLSSNKYSAHPDHPNPPQRPWSTSLPWLWTDTEEYRENWFDFENRNFEVIPESDGFTEEGNLLTEAIATTLTSLVFCAISIAIIEYFFKTEISHFFIFGVIGFCALVTIGVSKNIKYRMIFTILLSVSFLFIYVGLPILVSFSQFIWSIISNWL